MYEEYFGFFRKIYRISKTNFIMKKISFDNLKIMVETIKKHWPNKDTDYYHLALSTEFLRIAIQNEWTNKVIFDKNPSRKNRFPIGFMKSSINGVQWQERTSKLAERIYNLQGIKNIERVIEEINNGGLESAFAEIEGAAHLYRSNIPFEFVTPQGKLGKDFDIKILTDPPINCDVKHKLERIKRDIKKIINGLNQTLKNARKQVPKDEPSLFIIKIPEEWSAHGDSILVFLDSFLKKEGSKNIIGILFRWEERDPNNNMGFHWKYLLKRNDYFFPKQKKIDCILDRLSKTSSENWISFREMVR